MLRYRLSRLPDNDELQIKVEAFLPVACPAITRQIPYNKILELKRKIWEFSKESHYGDATNVNIPTYLTVNATFLAAAIRAVITRVTESLPCISI